MQPKFRLKVVLSGILLLAAILAAHRVFGTLPDRAPAPPALAALQLEQIDLPEAQLAPLVRVGAWRLSSPEPRVGGISGLAIDGEEIVAVTDSGVVLRFAKSLRRRMRARVIDLPAGPGDERFKMNRDAEALLRDSDGRGWWVAFENRDELWLFDPGFERALGRVSVPRRLLSENAGIEALAGSAEEMLAFPEDGGSVLRWVRGRWSQAPLDRRTAVSDAVEIDEQLLLLLERRLTVTGFDNHLALVRSDGPRLRTLWRKRLPVGPRDNLEAMAVERMGGGYRLWMMSDDNFHPRLRTVLVVVDVPAAALPKRP